MKKTTILSQTMETKITNALIAVKALKDHTIEVYRKLQSLVENMDNEHFATTEAVKEEVAAAKQIIEGLLSSAVNDLWDLSINQLPDNQKATSTVLQRNKELVGAQRDKILLLLKDSGVFE